MQEWISLRELGRRLGRRHRAVQRAIEEGRVPGSAVRRDPVTGRTVAVEFHAARLFWLERTDERQALRTAAPLRFEPEAAPAPPVQTCRRDEDALQAVALWAAFECALLALPAALAGVGLDAVAVDQVLECIFGAMGGELAARGEPPEACELLRNMVGEEIRSPGTWTA